MPVASRQRHMRLRVVAKVFGQGRRQRTLDSHGMSAVSGDESTGVDFHIPKTPRSSLNLEISVLAECKQVAPMSATSLRGGTHNTERQQRRFEATRSGLRFRCGKRTADRGLAYGRASSALTQIDPSRSIPAR